jgi:hypothetical protein
MFAVGAVAHPIERSAVRSHPAAYPASRAARRPRPGGTGRRTGSHRGGAGCAAAPPGPTAPRLTPRPSPRQSLRRPDRRAAPAAVGHLAAQRGQQARLQCRMRSPRRTPRNLLARDGKRQFLNYFSQKNAAIDSCSLHGLPAAIPAFGSLEPALRAATICKLRQAERNNAQRVSRAASVRGASDLAISLLA